MSTDESQGESTVCRVENGDKVRFGMREWLGLLVMIASIGAISVGATRLVVQATISEALESLEEKVDALESKVITHLADSQIHQTIAQKEEMLDRERLRWREFLSLTMQAHEQRPHNDVDERLDSLERRVLILEDR